MTLGELQDRVNEAIDNGWEDCPVHIRKFGTQPKYELDRIDLISAHAETEEETRYVELIYKE